MPNGHLTLEDGARAVRCGAVQSTVARIWNDKLQDVRGEVSRQRGKMGYALQKKQSLE